MFTKILHQRKKKYGPIAVTNMEEVVSESWLKMCKNDKKLLKQTEHFPKFEKSIPLGLIPFQIWKQSIIVIQEDIWQPDRWTD